MGLTPKQERNGIPPMPPAGGNVAQPGPPSPTVDSMMGAAESYGDAWLESGATPWQGGTAGTPGYGVKDWDANIAVDERPGER